MRAALTPICAIALCSLGCGGHPAPVGVPLPPVLCPEPVAPVLPRVDGARPLDAQIGVLSARERLLRGYIGSLGRTVDCYRAQTAEDDDAR